MDYNSSRKKLVLPEYGRHIQKMVDHAMTIDDREERTRCAKAIVGIMGNLFPHLRDISDFKHKLWDHIAIMADFKLDIDFPFNPPKPETFNQKPDKLPYNTEKIKFRHYGRTIEKLIEKAIEFPPGKEKDQLIILIGNHMKKSLFTWNKDQVTEDRIFNDMKRLSNNKLEIDEELKLPEQKEHFFNKSRKKNQSDRKQRPKRHHN